MNVILAANEKEEILEKKKMMHIGLRTNDIGRYVFLPGSPERTEKIAAHFENPKEVEE